MSDFEKIKNYLLDAEGEKLSNRSNDRGGLTKYGISQAAFPAVDIKNLTWNGACEIYKNEFFYKYHLQNIIDNTLAAQILLLFVNTNPIRAAKIVQSSLSQMGASIKNDGILGSECFNAINKANLKMLSSIIFINIMRFYLSIVDNDVTQLDNLRSWIRRSLLTL